MSILTRLFGSATERDVRKLWPIVDHINDLEPEIEALSDEDLAAKTPEFKQRLENGEDLDDILPEAFACVRESARRTIGQRHYDVQLLGGIVLHQGKISEMKTGEGKTLVATLPSYLNALTGRGVHIVTVNDYLARRDSDWMGPIHGRLGLSTGVVINAVQAQSPERRAAYAADITYGTNNEFGFDYLRDNMVRTLEECVQRDLYFAIVDEVDNILIDEARTPLIISAPAEESADMYAQFARLVPRLHRDDDFTLDEKLRTVAITDEGITKMEQMLGVRNIYDPKHFLLVHHMEQALRAENLYKLDVEYVVKEGQVVIVDEFTGRQMPGRRYSEGLHQAIEAKEGLKIERENITVATITFQNYFRLYEKLAGMTGTALTEAEELQKIYKLDVVVIPTHKPMIRDDGTDLIYMNEEAKYKAVIEEIVERHQTGQPVLVGTTSIEKSEVLSDLLAREGVDHQVLNAKHHEREAQIVAKAGEMNAVTISTNMAGRGTDIKLGEGVQDLGGLHIIGTERHESRRIDNQLRGRSGRQGDPGSTRFYLSLEDDLMRRFVPQRAADIIGRLGMDDAPLENKLVMGRIESAQKRSEGYNFDMRKHVVEYDDVVNEQRKVVYAERHRILDMDDLRSQVLEWMGEEITSEISTLAPGPAIEVTEAEAILEQIRTFLPLPADYTPERMERRRKKDVIEELTTLGEALYALKEDAEGEDMVRLLERHVMLTVVDEQWREHIDAIDLLRQGIGFRSVAQRDPLVEFKQEAARMWGAFMSSIRREVVHTIFKLRMQKNEPPPMAQQGANTGDEEDAHAGHQNGKRGPQVGTNGNGAAKKVAGQQKGMPPAVAAAMAKGLSRNAPCPCGSGRRFRKCHGKDLVGAGA